MEKNMTYHKYVFDEKRRKFIGDFEKMYFNEETGNYDSWYQDDSTSLTKRISLSILGNYNFNKVLDLGCGKGAFTHMLKKENNCVIGVDISETAIKKASSRYVDVKFICSDIQNYMAKDKEAYDLVVIGEVLSYLKNWPEILQSISKITNYIYLTLYIPDNPIGYVKSFAELEQKFKQHFNQEIALYDKIRSCIFLLGKVR
jgi:2-polyprenyl-3-methyl-5-hydroxy-6-metoxy-1,4-benzoquinol methylase